MLTLLFMVCIHSSLLLSTPPGSGTYISAHRGDVAQAPENTLAAIRSAVEKGAHQIELDVHITCDGHLVLMHDHTVDRSTDGNGAVPELDFATVRALDAGSWFAPEFTGERVPTLREALEAIPKPILVNVHLRNHPGIAEKSAALIAEMDRLDQAFLACTLAQAEAARTVAPDIMICNMDRQAGDRDAYITMTIEAKCDFIQLHHNQGLEGLEDDVARLHEAGVYVNWFGAEDPEVMRILATAGVDYILTDDLDLALETLHGQGTVSAEQ